jgi:hypothetical protein
VAITAGICDSFKLECLPTAAGIHFSGDTYKIALYTSAATLSPSTTVYSATNEVAGTGYAAGGQALSGLQTALDGSTAMLVWTTDPVWAASTITARGALIYNSSKANRAICVLDFGSDVTSTNGPFTVQFPADVAATALVRMS